MLSADLELHAHRLTASSTFSKALKIFFLVTNQKKKKKDNKTPHIQNQQPTPPADQQTNPQTSGFEKDVAHVSAQLGVLCFRSQSS